MKKIVIVGVVLVLLLVLTGCDKRDGTDIEVTSRYYVNVSDSWTTNSYNGYKCVSVDKKQDETGKYIITLVFDKVQK